MSNPAPTPRKPGTIYRPRSRAPKAQDVLDAVADGLQRAREALTAEGWALGSGPVFIGHQTYTKLG